MFQVLIGCAKHRPDNCFATKVLLLNIFYKINIKKASVESIKLIFSNFERKKYKKICYKKKLCYFYIALMRHTLHRSNKFFFIICVFRIVSQDAILFYWFSFSYLINKSLK